MQCEKDQGPFQRLFIEKSLLLGKQESEGSFEVISVSTLPKELVTSMGAPAQIWQWFKSPSADDRLFYNVLWVNKTATRMPEVSASLGKTP